MGCKDNIGLFTFNFCDKLVDWRRRKRRLRVIAKGARLHHDGFGINTAHFENLGPAKAEKTVTDHQAFPAGRKLPCYRLHAVSASAGHDHNALGVVDFLQGRRDVVHDTLERL